MNMKESLNKGVPIGTSVIIMQKDLATIVVDKKNFASIVNKYFKDYLNHIKKFTGTFDFEFFQTMEIRIDENTLEKYLCFAPSGLYSSLLFNLNIDDAVRKTSSNTKCIFVNNPAFLNKIMKEKSLERINVLRNLNSPKDLEQEFPLLYKKFIDSIEIDYEVYKRCIGTNNNHFNGNLTTGNINRQMRRKLNKTSKLSKTGKIESFEEYYQKHSNLKFSEFQKKYVSCITKLVNNLEKIINFMISQKIDLDGLNNKDKDKLELYFAYRYLDLAKQADSESKQDYLYYVSNYFVENKDKLNSDLAIYIGSNKGIYISEIINSNSEIKCITPKSLYEEYKKLLVDNPNLRDIDFSHLDFKGMNLQEVQQFMKEYLKDLSANWDFLSPEDSSYEDDVIRRIRGIRRPGKTEEEKREHQLRLLDLFMEKKRLYDSSDPFFRVKGKNTFDGYIGYVYPNGRVILDKFYDDSERNSLADGHAVYAMSIQEFYELSKLSKSELIKNKLCKRYIHKGNWAQRVLENEILPSSKEQPNVEVKKLIKRGDINQ